MNIHDHARIYIRIYTYKSSQTSASQPFDTAILPACRHVWISNLNIQHTQRHQQTTLYRSFRHIYPLRTLNIQGMQRRQRSTPYLLLRAQQFLAPRTRARLPTAALPSPRDHNSTLGHTIGAIQQNLADLPAKSVADGTDISEHRDYCTRLQLSRFPVWCCDTCSQPSCPQHMCICHFVHGYIMILSHLPPAQLPIVPTHPHTLMQTCIYMQTNIRIKTHTHTHTCSIYV